MRVGEVTVKKRNTRISPFSTFDKNHYDHAYCWIPSQDLGRGGIGMHIDLGFTADQLLGPPNPDVLGPSALAG